MRPNATECMTLSSDTLTYCTYEYILQEFDVAGDEADLVVGDVEVLELLKPEETVHNRDYKINTEHSTLNTVLYCTEYAERESCKRVAQEDTRKAGCEGGSARARGSRGSRGGRPAREARTADCRELSALADWASQRVGPQTDTKHGIKHAKK